MFAAAACAQIPSIDWEKNKVETLRHYRALVQIDSTAGNETRVVDYLKKVFEAEGIPTKTLALDPKRANLVARITGNGSKRPMLILAHTDVVGVQREKWPVDPFGAIMKDGYIWGRGSRDDKPVLTANLMTMLLLKRRGVPLDRDLIFLAESGEEADLTGVGINFVVNQHFDDIDAEFALTEGGGAKIDGDRVTVVNIGTAESRFPLACGSWRRAFRGTVRCRGSTTRSFTSREPSKDWAIGRRPCGSTTRRGPISKRCLPSLRPRKPRVTQLLFDSPRHSAEAQRWLAEHDPSKYSMLRTSVVPTMLKAGVGPNVIPSEAEATLDIRCAARRRYHRSFMQRCGELLMILRSRSCPCPPAGRLLRHRGWIRKCIACSNR